MVTNFPEFFYYFFFQEYFGILKNGQKKCPKMKITKKSWNFEKYLFFFKYTLKIYYSFSTITSFATFFIILSSFSASLSPLPPIASMINLLYLSECLEWDLIQSGYLFLKSDNCLVFFFAMCLIAERILGFPSVSLSHLSSSFTYNTSLLISVQCNGRSWTSKSFKFLIMIQQNQIIMILYLIKILSCLYWNKMQNYKIKC